MSSVASQWILFFFFFFQKKKTKKKVKKRKARSQVEKPPTHHSSQGEKRELLARLRARSSDSALFAALLTGCVTAPFQCDRPCFTSEMDSDSRTIQKHPI